MRDSRGDVEYELVEMDEELRFAPSKRLDRWLLCSALVLGAVLTLASVVRVVNEHDTSPRAAAMSPFSPTASESAPEPRSTFEPGSDMSPTGALYINVPYCPPSITCTRSAWLPVEFVAAVTEYLPGAFAQRKIVVTQTNPLRVYFRRVDVAAGEVTLTMRVTRSNILDGLGATSRTRSSAGATSSFIRLITPENYEVAIQANGPADRTPSLAALRALAADPRLLALG
jgi:hypothetical protein